MIQTPSPRRSSLLYYVPSRAYSTAVSAYAHRRELHPCSRRAAASIIIHVYTSVYKVNSKRAKKFSTSKRSESSVSRNSSKRYTSAATRWQGVDLWRGKVESASDVTAPQRGSEGNLAVTFFFHLNNTRTHCDMLTLASRGFVSRKSRASLPDFYWCFSSCLRRIFLRNIYTCHELITIFEILRPIFAIYFGNAEQSA